MYAELKDGSLINLFNADILIIFDNAKDKYCVIRKLNTAHTTLVDVIMECSTKENAKQIINVIKDGIVSEQKIIKIPTEEELERWSE